MCETRSVFCDTTPSPFLVHIYIVPQPYRSIVFNAVMSNICIEHLLRNKDANLQTVKTDVDVDGEIVTAAIVAANVTGNR